MLIPSVNTIMVRAIASLSRRVNANSQQALADTLLLDKLIKKGEC